MLNPSVWVFSWSFCSFHLLQWLIHNTNSSQNWLNPCHFHFKFAIICDSYYWQNITLFKKFLDDPIVDSFAIWLDLTHKKELDSERTNWPMVLTDTEGGSHHSVCIQKICSIKMPQSNTDFIGKEEKYKNCEFKHCLLSKHEGTI